MLNTNISSPEFKTLANFLYPKRSYIVVDDPNYDPNITFGGKWEKLAEGYTLWTTTSGGGGTNPEGLPNITGEIKAGGNSKGWETEILPTYNNDLMATSGALGVSKGTTTDYIGHGSQTASPRVRSITFNAKSSNSIYGASDHVVPKGYKVIIWRRTELWGGLIRLLRNLFSRRCAVC